MKIFDFLKKINIEVKNKKIIEEAFTHSSYVNENRKGLKSNERLEFIGDAVLQIYTSRKIYALKPELDEGKMTSLRAYLVNEKALASYVREYGLNVFLKLGAGEEKTGGRDRDSVVANMFEAFVGAVYLDQGYDVVFEMLDTLIGSKIKITDDIIDYKTQLQEFVQADKRSAIEYQLIKSSGPSNDPIFEMVVKVDGIPFGYGVASSKKQAQKLAAKDALLKMAK